MASPEITLTHLDEPLFDGAGATKRDLVDYLEVVADRIVPVLSGRPLSVIRVRAGQRPFMQKNVPDYAPPWVKTGEDAAARRLRGDRRSSAGGPQDGAPQGRTLIHPMRGWRPRPPDPAPGRRRAAG